MYHEAPQPRDSNPLSLEPRWPAKTESATCDSTSLSSFACVDQLAGGSGGLDAYNYKHMLRQCLQLRFCCAGSTTSQRQCIISAGAQARYTQKGWMYSPTGSVLLEVHLAFRMLAGLSPCHTCRHWHSFWPAVQTSNGR